MKDSIYYTELLKAIEFHERELEKLRNEVARYEDRACKDPKMFSSKLRIKMKNNKVSQMDLANQLGVCQKTVSRYVTGDANPDAATQRKILRALNICIERKMIDNGN